MQLPQPVTDLLSFFRAGDGIRDGRVTGVQTCALPISAIQSRASCRNSSTVGVSSAIRYSSNSREHAEVLAVPGRIAERRRVRRDAPEIEMLVVFGREPDPAEDLEAGLDEIDARVADERLGHARRLGAVAVVGPDVAGRGERDRLAHLERQARVRELVL